MVSARSAAVHVGLFVACCATTWWYGALAFKVPYGGPAFAGTLMSILLCHELGHYFVGRRRGVDVSLPYFIPLPPQVTLGTLGAVIRMRNPIADRNALFDVGAAGPVAGLVVAVPLLVIGLSLSDVVALAPNNSNLEGNSILYALLKYAVFHRWLPGDGHDVQLHPMAQAGWVGLLITMINLMPIGQLDGGHIARAVLGDAHETWSRRLHKGLAVFGLGVGAVMFIAAIRAGHPMWSVEIDRDNTVVGAVVYALHGVLPWLTWTALIGAMRWQTGEYHPPVGETPLDPRRRRYAIALLVMFFLIATPVPFRPAL